MIDGNTLVPSMCVSMDGNESQKRFARLSDNEGPAFYSPFILSPTIVDSQIRVTGKDRRVALVSLGLLYQIAVLTYLVLPIGC